MLPGLVGVAGMGALLPLARDRGLFGLWLLGLPPLAFLTLFATPDAPLLGLCGLCLLGALRGGRWWLLAGAAAGLAVLSKHTGGLFFGLLVLFAGPEDWRRPWLWIAIALAAVLSAPNLLWNLDHDWVTLRFQWTEGLAHHDPPGLVGPVLQILGQLAVVTPVAAAAGVLWAVTAVRDLRHDRELRLLWGASVPLLAFFAMAALWGPPEAHWPAPAWLAVGLGLARSSGRVLKAAWMGTWLALFCTLLLAWHGTSPLVRVPDDPAARLTEGPLVAAGVAAWALPAGVAPRAQGSDRGVPVYTERYQEAAFIHYYTGIPARVYPGCARRSQYDLWPHPPVEAAFMVRPTTSGPALCTDEDFAQRRGPHDLAGIDEHGRRAGSWQLFEVAR